jgi:hypothetical protein
MCSQCDYLQYDSDTDSGESGQRVGAMNTETASVGTGGALDIGSGLSASGLGGSIATSVGSGTNFGGAFSVTAGNLSGAENGNSNNNRSGGNWALMMIRLTNHNRILLLRHRLLWDLMLHSTFVASKLQEWKSARHWHLMEVLVRIGYPFDQCHQPWAFIGPGMRSRLR